ncbi:MAG: hypothetical protein L6R48_01790 [Planctomycetes bacterium]|nr:hypothetical protein [Planctomycetota bacterium]
MASVRTASVLLGTCLLLMAGCAQPPARPADGPAAAAPVPADADGRMLVDWRPAAGATAPTLWLSPAPAGAATRVAPGAGAWAPLVWRLDHVAPAASAKPYAFYRLALPAPVVVAPDDDLVLEAELLVLPQKPAEVTTVVELCASTETYGGPGEPPLHRDGVMRFATVHPLPGPQRVVSLPVSRGALAVADPRVRSIGITGLALRLHRALPGQPLAIELAGLRLRRAQAEDRRAAQLPPAPLRGFQPADHRPLLAAFRYGYWGGLGSGFNPWAQPLLPRGEHALASLDILLEAGADTAFTTRIHGRAEPSPSVEEVPVAAAREQIATLHAAGIASIAMTYLGRYYHRHRTTAQAQALIADTVAALKDAPGLLAYYPIDEPYTDDESLAIWRETMDAFRQADPARPALTLHDTLDGAKTFAALEPVPCLDLYPFTTGGRLFDTTGGDALMAARVLDDLFRSRGTRSTWVMDAAWGNSFNMVARLPTPAEVRLQAWSVLAHGARSLFHFALSGHGLRLHADMREAIVGAFDLGYRPVGAMGGELVALGEVLPPLATALVGTTWDPATPLAVAGDGAADLRASWNPGPGHAVVACYNRSLAAARSGAVRIPDHLVAGRQVVDLRRDRALAPGQDGYPLHLEAGDGTLLAIGDAAVIARLRQAADARRLAPVAARFRLLAHQAEAAGIAIAGPRAQAAAVAAADPGQALAGMRAALAGVQAALDADPAHTAAATALAELSRAVSAANQAMLRHLSDTRGAERGADGSSIYPWNRQLLTLSAVYVLLRNGLFCGRTAAVAEQAAPAAALARALADGAGQGRFALADAATVEAALARARGLEGLVGRELAAALR